MMMMTMKNVVKSKDINRKIEKRVTKKTDLVEAQ